MEVYDEMIHTIEGIRVQCFLWKGIIWDIFCNDRFEAEDYKIKVHCEICGPEKFVPKVLDYCGHKLCNTCITHFSEMLQAATLADCRRNREEREALQKNLKKYEPIEPIELIEPWLYK